LAQAIYGLGRNIRGFINLLMGKKQSLLDQILKNSLIARRFLIGNSRDKNNPLDPPVLYPNPAGRMPETPWIVKGGIHQLRIIFPYDPIQKLLDPIPEEAHNGKTDKEEP